MADEGKRPSWVGKLQPMAPRRRALTIELLVIDLSTCARCVPTGARLTEAVRLLAPIAESLGVGLDERTTVVGTPEEARRRALVSSPTIRINGRDIAQDIRESRCESCGEIAGGGASIDCREWHYKGKVYSAAPLPMLLEAIMRAMLDIDAIPMAEPRPLAELPDNLERFFRGGASSSCCG